MRLYASLFISTFISTIYTILTFFAITGFERNGILEVFSSRMSANGVGVLLIVIIFLCISLNVLLTFILVKKNWQKPVNFFLYTSFICGCLFVFFIAKSHFISEFIYSNYIDLFYQGVRYSFEDEPQQIITYIPRVMIFSFFLGFILSCILVAVKKVCFYKL